MRATSYLSYFSARVLRLVWYYGGTLRAKENAERKEGTERTTKIRIARERIRDSTKKREYKRIEDERRRRNGDREGNEVSEGKATNSVTASPARPN